MTDDAGTTGFAWDPRTYRELMAREVPDYPHLQEQLVRATSTSAPRAVLELGVGSGLTAARLLEAHPAATLVGIDANVDMLAAARETLDPRRSALHRARLEDPLPAGPFDLVVSMLAVHHLDRAGKAELFAAVADVLPAGGRFVLGDLIVPEDPDDVVTPIDGVHDVPSSLPDQLSWLATAGLGAEVFWRHRDLAVITSTKPG